MKVRLPLYLRILLWFLLNVAVLVAAFYLVISLQFRQGMSSALGSLAGDRIQVLTQDLNYALSSQPFSEWTNTLRKIGAKHQAQVALYAVPDRHIAGDQLQIPHEIHEEAEALFPNPPHRDGPPGRDRPPPHRDPSSFEDNPFGDPFLEAILDEPPSGGPPPRAWPTRLGFFIKKSEFDGRNWLAVRFPPPVGMQRQGPLMLFVVSSSMTANGLIFDLRPWLWSLGGALVVSALLWLPFVRGITRSLRQTMNATEQIARGQFDARAPESRSDELGRMAQAVNHMAVQLDGYVRGQKRFLGDIAHELCSPIARMEMGLGILEQQLGESHGERMQDVKEELRNMSAMVNELLSFSKAAVGVDVAQLQPIALRSVIEEVLHTEALPADSEWLEIPDRLEVLGQRDLLKRAVGNVLRNALRHGAAPVEISASPSNGYVILSIADSGPGVPQESLPRLFEPFYRVDTARARETGGTGLGLAIVKTCVEACQGTVSARNVDPHGLEIVLTLVRVDE